jgi:hypothetical protein
MMKKYCAMSLALLYTTGTESLPSRSALVPVNTNLQTTEDNDDSFNAKLLVSLCAIIAEEKSHEDVIKDLENLQVSLTQQDHRNALVKFDAKSVINKLIAKETKSATRQVVQKQQIQKLTTEINGLKDMFSQCCPSRVGQQPAISPNASLEQQIEQLTQEVGRLKQRYQKYCCTPTKKSCCG